MLEKEWLLTCAPIGTLETSGQSWKACASGVFIYDNPFIWYVTSYQKICIRNDISLYLLLRHKKESQILFDVSSMHKQENIDWIFDKQNDIAATLFPADPDFDIKAIGFEGFLTSQDMLPGMNCYSIGYPYLLAEQDTQKIEPSVLAGIISKIDDQQSKVYVTAPIFTGNYGCPLFIWKSRFNSKNSIIPGNPSIYLGGIITKTISIQPDIDTDGNHISLGIMCSSELIKKLIFNPNALAQKEKLKRKKHNELY